MVALAVLTGLLAGCASSERFLWEEYTGLGINSLADGDYPRAEQLLSRALTKAEDLGPTEQGISLNGLGELYRLQRRHGDAERMFTRSLALKEAALGREHPDVATTLTNLGLVYIAEGCHEEAVPLLERALDIQQTASVKTAWIERTLTALAEAYRRSGQEDRALEADARRRLLREQPAPRR